MNANPMHIDRICIDFKCQHLNSAATMVPSLVGCLLQPASHHIPSRLNPIYAIIIHCVLPLATKLIIQQECSRERLHHRRFCSPLKASLRFSIFKTIYGQLLGSVRVV